MSNLPKKKQLQAIAYGKKAAADYIQSGAKHSVTVACNKAGVSFFMSSTEEISPEEIALVRHTVMEELVPTPPKY